MPKFGRRIQQSDGTISGGNVSERGRRDGLPGSVGGVVLNSTEDR